MDVFGLPFFKIVASALEALQEHAATVLTGVRSNALSN